MMVLVLMACLSAIVSGVFFLEVAVPHLIHLPFHHCPYDLVPRAPESLVGVVLFVTGLFAICWACAVEWLGRHPDTVKVRSILVARLLDLAVLCYSGSLLMLSVEMALT